MRERCLQLLIGLFLACCIALAGCSDDTSSDTNAQEAAMSIQDDSNSGVGTETGTSDAVDEQGITGDCGDGICAKDEDCIICQVDCGLCTANCGDNVCDTEIGETCDTCPADCSPCSGECGDGQCTQGEDCTNCESDCGTCEMICGDSTCQEGESCDNCPVDCGECPVSCGDATCDADEDCENCSEDCGPCSPLCGDGWCSEEAETCESCPVDCGACGSACGDGECDAFEDCETCSDDCGSCPVSCGDGVCEEGEDCDACPADCGACPCPILPSTAPLLGNVICQPTGCAANSVDCSLKIARQTEATEAASAIQFKLQYDATRLLLENLYDEICYTETLCEEVPLAKTGAKPNHTGHVFTLLPPGEIPNNPEPGIQYLWNGSLNAIVANYGGSGFSLTDAYLDEDGTLNGDAHVAWFRFQLLEDIETDNPGLVTLITEGENDLIGAGPSLVDLPAIVQDGVIVIQSP